MCVSYIYKSPDGNLIRKYTLLTLRLSTQVTISIVYPHKISNGYTSFYLLVFDIPLQVGYQRCNRDMYLIFYRIKYESIKKYNIYLPMLSAFRPSYPPRTSFVAKNFLQPLVAQINHACIFHLFPRMFLEK